MGQNRNHMEFRKYFKLNENCNIAYQNLWKAAKEVIKGKLRALNT